MAPFVSPRDPLLALALLTRLPVRLPEAAFARGAAAAWAWPLAGLVVAGIAGAGGALALWAGLPPLFVAALVLALQALVTGALHEDGLADCADGVWGGTTPARRLEIMKDSRIGAYGTLALILTVLARAALLASLAALGPAPFLAALVAAACLSRAAMAGVMAALPHARPGGLAAAQGRPGAPTVLLGLAVALGLATAGLGAVSLAAAIAAMTAALGAAALARARLGGQTGDVLGASQQMAEIAVLMVLAALAA